MEKEVGMEVSRKNYLTAAGAALLAASTLSLPAEADEGNKEGDTLYGHGMVWNRALPGVAGELRLSFDLRVDLKTGIGFGTASDSIHPLANTHFSISSIVAEKRPKGETRYTMKGIVTEANDPANVGLPVRILAETSGDTTAIAIAIGDMTFGGAGLVVIAIIAVLIALLVPAVQKVR